MEEKMANYFKVLSDPVRLEVIRYLIEGETCSCTIIDKVSVSQPTLSYHLKTIANAGLSTSIRDGNQIKYYINKEKVDEMIQYLQVLRNMESEQCKL